VGVRPDENGVIAGVPDEPGFRLEAFSDEGLEGPATHDRPVTHYSDYNMLLQDPGVELVLVDGPVELRRDLAVRALNAGRHVVLHEPFSESAVDAERVMKTALRHGLAATMDVPWPDDPDLLALECAIREENVAGINGAFCFWPTPQQDDPGSPEPMGGMLEEVGLNVLYQMRLLVRADIRCVSAHLLRATPGGPEQGFLLYLALRGDGWAIAQVGTDEAAGLPKWVLQAPHATFTASDGNATVATGGERRTYAAPDGRQGFWANLYDAVREGTRLKCHPVDIVRAMKLHEAALESIELGEPVTV
jgi:predicted dehydrogenase